MEFFATSTKDNSHDELNKENIFGAAQGNEEPIKFFEFHYNQILKEFKTYCQKMDNDPTCKFEHNLQQHMKKKICAVLEKDEKVRRAFLEVDEEEKKKEEQAKTESAAPKQETGKKPRLPEDRLVISDIKDKKTPRIIHSSRKMELEMSYQKSTPSLFPHAIQTPVKTSKTQFHDHGEKQEGFFSKVVNYFGFGSGKKGGVQEEQRQLQQKKQEQKHAMNNTGFKPGVVRQEKPKISRPTFDEEKMNRMRKSELMIEQFVDEQLKKSAKDVKTRNDEESESEEFFRKLKRVSDEELKVRLTVSRGADVPEGAASPNEMSNDAFRLNPYSSQQTAENSRSHSQYPLTTCSKAALGLNMLAAQEDSEGYEMTDGEDEEEGSGKEEWRYVSEFEDIKTYSNSKNSQAYLKALEDHVVHLKKQGKTEEEIQEGLRTAGHSEEVIKRIQSLASSSHDERKKVLFINNKRVPEWATQKDFINMQVLRQNVFGDYKKVFGKLKPVKQLKTDEFFDMKKIKNFRR